MLYRGLFYPAFFCSITFGVVALISLRRRPWNPGGTPQKGLVTLFSCIFAASLAAFLAWLGLVDKSEEDLLKYLIPGVVLVSIITVLYITFLIRYLRFCGRNPVIYDLPLGELDYNGLYDLVLSPPTVDPPTPSRQPYVASEITASDPLSQSLAEGVHCVICFEKVKNTLVLPCTHRATCHSCAVDIMAKEEPRCPMCREPIDALTKIPPEHYNFDFPPDMKIATAFAHWKVVQPVKANHIPPLTTPAQVADFAKRMGDPPLDLDCLTFRDYLKRIYPVQTTIPHSHSVPADLDSPSTKSPSKKSSTSEAKSIPIESSPSPPSSPPRDTAASRHSSSSKNASRDSSSSEPLSESSESSSSESSSSQSSSSLPTPPPKSKPKHSPKKHKKVPFKSKPSSHHQASTPKKSPDKARKRKKKVESSTSTSASSILSASASAASSSAALGFSVSLTNTDSSVAPRSSSKSPSDLSVSESP